MSLATFCREQLLLRGPHSLDELTAAAVDAGITRAKKPEYAVRSALSHEVGLGDDRWASPLGLLEGRCLLTRRLTTDNPYEEPASWYVEQDLRPLSFALRGGPIELASGGQLQHSWYGGGLAIPDGWPSIEPAPDQLLCLSVVGGRLDASVVPDSPGVHQRGKVLAAALAHRAVDGRHRWADAAEQAIQRLWRALADTPALLTQPTGPLSECLPELAVEAASKRAAYVYQATHWKTDVSLPRDLQDVVISAACDADRTQDEWLNDFVVQSLLRLQREGDVYTDKRDADMLRW